jgi:hypothetical protein
MSLPKGDIVSQVAKLSNALLFSVIIGKKKRERIAALEAQAGSSVRAGGDARTPSTDGAQMLPSPSKTPPDYNAVIDNSASFPSISAYDPPDCFVQPVNLALDSSPHGDPAFTLSEDQLHDTSQYDFNFEGILDFSLLADDSMSPVHSFYSRSPVSRSTNVIQVPPLFNLTQVAQKRRKALGIIERIISRLFCL